MTARVAAVVLIDAADYDIEPVALLRNAAAVRLVFREAAKNTHPDRHKGDSSRFHIVETAKRTLDNHHER